MKKCNFLVIVFLVVVFLENVNFAQEAVSSESIDLPDVSTVISGGAPKVGKSAVPDYSKILPIIENSEIVPKMPDVGNVDNQPADIAELFSNQKKSVYAEGVAGLGFPGLFLGNFSIYRQTGSNPFKITFGHETVNGYAEHSLMSGFFDKKTYIDGEKKFSSEKTKLIVSGMYSSFDNGLQNNSDNISDVTKEELGVSSLFNIDFTQGLSLGASVNGKWYKRYGNIVGDSNFEDFSKKVSILDFNPEINFSWETHGIYSKISTIYELSYDAEKVFNKHNSNRFDFSLLVGWKNENIDLYGSADAVVGNKIGNNSVVVPFTIGSNFDFITGISSRKVRISAKGGIESYVPKISNLEKKYTFSSMNCLPEETSDWYGSININLPFKDILTIYFDGIFKKTAFNNGTWQVDYDSVLGNDGQYLYKIDEMTQVNTNIGFSFIKGIATFSSYWKSYWGDVPCIEIPNQISCLLSLQDNKSRISFDTGIAFYFGDNIDNVPVIDFDFTVKVSDAVRLALTGSDVVKLITGESRTYAGEYIQRSGSASILVKFFF